MLAVAVFCVALLMPAFARAASPDLADVLNEYLKEHYPWTEVEVSDLKVNGDTPPGAPLAVTVEKAPPGRTVFHIEYSHRRNLTVNALVKACDRIMISRNAFRKGHTLGKDDVYATCMDISRIPRGAVRDEDRVVGKPLTRSVVANMPLTDTMISETPLVKRGHRILLLASGSGLTIKAPGEIKQDAMVGDYVKAMNLLSKKVITGLLIDENTVRVEF